MEPNIQNRLMEIEDKVDAIFTSVEKTRKYFLIITWITVALVVLPAIGMVFALPAFMSNFSSLLQI